MRKNILFSLILFALCVYMPAFAVESAFTKAIRTCSKYSQTGNISRGGEIYTMTITLENKNNSCLYKEKISLANESTALNCTFPKSSLDFIANHMEEYNDNFKAEIDKNKIYEAKLTNNYKIFEKYLIDPQYCRITNSKTK